MAATVADAEAIERALKLLEPYTRGSKAWFEDSEECWVRATLVQRTDDETLGIGRLVFTRDDATAASTSAAGILQENDGSLDDLARQVARGSRLTGGRLSSTQRVGARYVVDIAFGELAEAGDALLPPLSNPAMLDGAADLTTLSYLHEAAVLHNLRRRYEQRQIYTYSGVVLVALNPFAAVDAYSGEWMARYAGGRGGEAPHVFAIAENAYRGMGEGRQNQTIVVYGESGSGKTTSAKYIMRYFAQAHQGGGAEQLSAVEAQMLATNPVFEAFGNARTTRNDNSSRFGKFLDIQFDRRAAPRIVGGRIRTFLLERSRVAYQAATERNYHVFYQLLAGASDALRGELELGQGDARQAWQAFHYTRQGGAGSGEVAGVDDGAEFGETCRALDTVGVDAQQRNDIWRVLAGILHLGNVSFGGGEAAGAHVDAAAEGAFATAARLLGVDAARLRQWLTRRQIVTRHDRILAKVARAQAVVIRDSVAKFLYARLFDWLLGPVNASLGGAADAQAAFVGVLDIYGFEHFAANSFEQFCINYANEKLQQHFNHHVFKLEQDEYRREQLASWTFVDFRDNQPCIDLIEGRMGILALLDEESRLEQGSDRSFAEKLYRQYGGAGGAGGSGGGGGDADASAYFCKPRFSNTAFTVRHYAHDVTYEAEGFLEKNKDAVPDEVRRLLGDSSFGFVAALAAQDAAAGGRRAPTLGGVFKRSLGGLLATLGETAMHYIRCIKPNAAQAAWQFSAPLVLAQLRACGVLETIRISKAGYPSRVPMRTFNERYAVVLGSSAAAAASTSTDDDERALCQQILDCCLPDATQYQVGLTKVFLRAGQWAVMEKRRSLVFERSALVIQTYARRVLVQRAFARMRAAAVCIQRAWRSLQFARACEARRRARAVRVIEEWWVHVQQERRVRAACCVQALVRGYLARCLVQRLRVERERRQEAERAERAEWERRQAVERAESQRLAEEAARAEQQAVSQLEQAESQPEQNTRHRFPATILLDAEPDEPAAYDEYMAQVPTKLRTGSDAHRSSEAHAEALARLNTAAPQTTPDAARRRRTAEARASLIAAATASRTSEAGLALRPLAASSHSLASQQSAPSTSSRNTFGFHEAAPLQLIPEHSPQQQHQQQRQSRATHRHHDSLTIGDDIFAIINEFSAVAGGRYGEVDARSLRKGDAKSSSRPPSRYPKPAPSPSPNPAQLQDARRSWLIAALRTSQDDDSDEQTTSVPTPRPDSPPLGSAFGSSPFASPPTPKHSSPLPTAQQQQQAAALAAAAGLLHKQGSFASSNARSRQEDSGGRHTAARARAWAARQRDRMRSAFSGERGDRRSHTSLADSAGSTSSKPSEDQGRSFEDALPRMRFLQHSQSTSNVAAPFDPDHALAMMPPPPAHRFGRAPSAASFR